MKTFFQFASPIVVAAVLAAVTGISFAQTPAQMEYERQQREYWRQQEQQRQEQQRQQQLMQDNARRQQEESNRANSSAGQASGGQGATPTQPSQGRGAKQSAADNLSAARALWEKRPALAADHNPLLGKWTRPASSRTNSKDPFAGLQALAKGGLCEALFGGGVFEFRPDKLVGMDDRTRETELDKVEYRGDAKHVVVIPKTTLKLMEFDVEGPNRISWTGQNCVLERVGTAQAGASAATATVVKAAASPAARPAAANTGGVLALSVVAASPINRVAGRKLWVLKEDAQVALIKGGLKSTPNGSALQIWMRACQARGPDCEKGAGALKAYSVGIATTDASGHATTPPLPTGRYWILSDAKVDNKHVMWNVPVEVKGGDKSVTLDERNAKPVD